MCETLLLENVSNFNTKQKKIVFSCPTPKCWDDYGQIIYTCVAIVVIYA